MTQSSLDPIKHENDMATSRFQGLVLMNGLWMLAYFQKLEFPGMDAKIDPTLGEAIATARCLLSLLGITSTALFSVALWYGLKHLNAYWKLQPSQPSLLQVSAARVHYYVVPIILIGFWAFLANAMYSRAVLLAVIVDIVICGVAMICVLTINVTGHVFAPSRAPASIGDAVEEPISR